MNITSFEFLFLFIPLLLVAYYILPAKKSMTPRNILLLLASLAFYAWGEPIRILLLIVLIAIAWLLGLMANGRRRTAIGKWAVALSVIINIGSLFVYKYLDFLLENIGYVTSTELPSLGLSLPLGLSFFCFSSISYVVDVYRTKTPVQKNIFDLALFLSLFTKIVSGPIMQYNQFEDQIKNRRTTPDQFAEGIWRFIFGLGKKVILSGTLAQIVTYTFEHDYQTLPVSVAWLGSFAYMLQLYLDFSGYSDMAIGLSAMFGFKMPENFIYPYTATSVTEFWQKWHKSLGEWFRDYMYYPLTLGPAIKLRKWITKRYSKKAAKLWVNIFTLGLIWLSTGLWHGPTWNYVIWGLVNGAFSLWELYRKPFKNAKLDRAFGWFYTIFLTYILKSFTYVETLSEAFHHYGAMLGVYGNEFFGTSFEMIIREYWVFLLIGTICCFPVAKLLSQKINDSGNKVLIVSAKTASVIFALCVFAISLSFSLRGGFTAFLYQNF